MSRLRVMVDGKPTWKLEDPARARPVGHGGAAMGQFGANGVTLTAHQRRSLARREAQRRKPQPPLGRRGT